MLVVAFGQSALGNQTVVGWWWSGWAIFYTPIGDENVSTVGAVDVVARGLESIKN